MFFPAYFIIIAAVQIGLSQGFVKVAVLNKYSFTANSGDREFFRCYISGPDLSRISVRSRRVTRTLNYDYYNPAPDQPYRVHQGVYNVELSTGTNGAFGVFACDVTLNEEETSVQTILLRSDAYIIPKDERLTKTVDVGDNGVTIEMEELTPSPSSRNRHANWRKDNLDPPFSGQRTFTLPVPTITSGPVSLADAGVYECHHAGQRNNAVQGLQRLIVRECSSGRWGPPDCYGVCDNCYHGGVCDDKTGECICPAGFMGPNCLTACNLRGRFGFECELDCIEGSRAVSACRGSMICLPDPFGCQCASGFKGVGCESDCEQGSFGANCLQTCHCQTGFCSAYTGVCPNNQCEQGYSGRSCQIPPVCKTGYFGDDCLRKCHCADNVACDRDTGRCSNGRCARGYETKTGSQHCQGCAPGLFGEGCSEECHCEEPCDNITGSCTGTCKTPWGHWTPKCQSGISSISYTKVNPNSRVQFVCTVTSPTFVTSLTAVLFRVSSGIPSVEIYSSGGYRTRDTLRYVTSTTDAGDVNDGDEIACVLAANPGTTRYRDVFRSTIVSFYTLPTLSSIPRVILATNTSITISWQAWNETKDKGDPPIIEYRPYIKTGPGELVPAPTGIAETQYTFEDLDPDTKYSFRVAAVREGANGEGEKGQKIFGKTICTSPPGAPNKVQVEELDSGGAQVSWEKPDTATVGCSTGVTMFKIYYRSVDTKEEMLNVDDVNETSAFIAMSLEPGKNFSFQLTFVTSGGESARSSEAHLLITLPVPTTVATNNNGAGPQGNKSSGGSTVMFIVIPLLLIIVLVAFIVFFVIRRKRNSIGGKLPQGATYPDVHTQNPVYDNTDTGNEVTYDNADITTTSNGRHQASVMPAAVPAKQTPVPPRQTPVPARQTMVDDWDGDMEGTTVDDDDENVYGNLQKPEPVKVTSLPDYVAAKTRSKTDSLIHQFMILPKDERYPCTVGKKEQNKKKNRFRNMLAYDKSRVVLEIRGDDPDSDYYNACYMKDQNGQVAFIASQGPNKASIDDFWRMVWMTDVSIIVMVTNLIENGKDRCTQYWPEKEGQAKQWGRVTVSWSGTQQFANHIIRDLTISQDDEQRTVCQYHFVTWPDMGVPKEPTALISLVRQVKRQNQGKTAPVLVHCSAGIGRTGTFIALYCLTDVLEKEKYINVYEFVEKMREDRINMVQTAVQYQFLYDALVEVYRTKHTEIPTRLLMGFDIQSKKGLLQEEFMLLNDLSKDLEQTSMAGQAPENVAKNRFPDIMPPDRNRPFLSGGPGFKENDYINATFINSYAKKDAFITTQSPLPYTIEGFWRLVCDWKVPVIIMLNQLDNRNKRCPCYWPEEDEASTYGSVTISKMTENNQGSFMHRQFEVNVEGKQAHYVDHFQLLSWLNPLEYPNGLAELLHSAYELMQYHPTAPGIIQCIDGVGSSGSVAVVLSEVDRVKHDDRVDIFQSARQLRTGNVHFLHDEHHYILCYKILQQYLGLNNEYGNI